MERYHVLVHGDELAFSAAHFITYGGGECERLHGHNYRVSAEVHGPLDENHYVVDFVALRETLKGVLGELDHRVLLPAQHPRIRIAADDREVTAAFEDRRWVFPRSGCLLLPVANTTAELLARWIGERLHRALEAQTGTRPARIRVAVEESFGQTAVCEISDA